MRNFIGFIILIILIFVWIVVLSQPLEKYQVKKLEDGKVVSIETSYKWHPEKITKYVENLINKLKSFWRDLKDYIEG